jgi:hypothetical protein
VFEWGYLIAKMATHKLHVFLIGVSKEHLSSDLAEIWAEEIKNNDNKTSEQIATEIANVFLGAVFPIY